jgi:hypothetical protein
MGLHTKEKKQRRGNKKGKWEMNRKVSPKGRKIMAKRVRK